MCNSDGYHVVRKKVCHRLKQAMYRFVLNVRDGGRCHLVPPDAMSLPKQKRRSVCGWRFGSAVSLTVTKTSNAGSLCLRCFPKGVVVVQDGNDSPIEQYAD